MKLIGGVIFLILLALFIVIQAAAAVDGIGYYWGHGVALGIVTISLMFGFALPITIGAFLGALVVWEWHWLGALLFAAPGLLLMLPGAIGALIAFGRTVFAKRA